MLNAFILDPLIALDSESDGLERAMVEILILMAFHHDASKLEYRTIDGKFRAAEIVDGFSHEFPQLPNCLRLPTMDHLRRIFSTSMENNQSERMLRVDASLAVARCDIANDNLNATVTLLGDFSPTVDLLVVMNRFWRKRATAKGLLGLAKYELQRGVWRVEELANHAMNRSRGSSVS